MNLGGLNQGVMNESELLKYKFASSKTLISLTNSISRAIPRVVAKAQSLLFLGWRFNFSIDLR